MGAMGALFDTSRTRARRGNEDACLVVVAEQRTPSLPSMGRESRVFARRVGRCEPATQAVSRMRVRAPTPTSPMALSDLPTRGRYEAEANKMKEFVANWAAKIGRDLDAPNPHP